MTVGERHGTPTPELEEVEEMGHNLKKETFSQEVILREGCRGWNR